MAFTVNGLTPCPGGDCHGIDHAWCAPGRHQPYDDMARFHDGLGVWLELLCSVYLPRHKRHDMETG